MDNLYTNVAPLRVPEEETIKYNVKQSLKESDKAVIAVGYFSKEGLETLDKWVHEAAVKDVLLIGGMYSVDGIPASIYNKIEDIHQKWQQEGIGKILLVNNMNYHGKLYTFWKDGHIFKSIIGSANLGAIAPTSATLRQYELASYVTDQGQNLQFEKHLSSLEKCTTSADNLDGNFKKIHEKIELLKGIEGVSTLTDSSVKDYENATTDAVIKIPIKAPHYKDRFKNEKKYYTHSNINVCYSKGRKDKKGKIQPRNWFEFQITCSKQIINSEFYPKTTKPFFIVTDDNYMFEAHTTSSNHKQLSAYGSDRVFGRWIKGRLVSAGLLQAYDNATQDKNRDGMVTIEMLERSKMRVLELRKTTMKYWGKVYELKSNGKLDKKKAPHMEALDVWFASFSDNLENDK